MGERPDQVTGDSRLREHDVRGRGSEDVFGRASDERADVSTEDTARIRSDIERTREDMSETIDAIQDKLSPRNLAAQARESVKEATVGRVRNAASSVSETASNVAEQTREAAVDMAQSVRENPWPAILIGVGTAWMLYGRGRGNGRNSSYTKREYRDDGTTGYYEADTGTTGIRAGAGARAGGYGMEGSSTSGYDTASGYGAAGSYRSRGSSYGAGQNARQLVTSARTSLNRAGSQVQGLVQRNPLAVSVMAAAIGVAVGLAIPETERENRLMGETRDNLVERAQDAAQDAVEKVKQVAGDAANKL